MIRHTQPQFFRRPSPVRAVAVAILMLAVALDCSAQHALQDKPAPALHGEDQDGNPIRLEDYRGKVVMVHFWYNDPGDLAQHRKLAALYEGMPFQMIGAYRDHRQYKRMAEREQITWPCILDKRQHDSSHVKWKAFPLPRTFLVDDKGVIRAAGLKGQELQDGVDELLERCNAVLEVLLESQNPDERALGGFRMAKHRLPGAKSLLLAVQGSESKVARQRVATGLSLLQKPPEPFRQLLLQAVDDADRFVRVASLQCISKYEIREGAEQVIAAIADDDMKVSHAAIAAAQELQLEKAVDNLLAIVNEGESDSAGLAAFALSEIHPSGTAALERLAQKKGHPSRLTITLAIHKIQPETTEARFAQLLSDADADVRKLAARAASKLEDFDSTELFVAALANQDADVRHRACKVLYESNDDEARQKLNDYVNRNLTKLIPKLASFRNAPAVAGEIRKLGPAAAKPLLDRFFKEKDKRLRNGLATALSRLRNPDSVPRIVEKLKDLTIDNHFRQALQSAVGVNTADGLNEIAALTRHDESIVRESGVRILWFINDDKTIPTLLERLQDKNGKVKRLAAESLARKSPPHPLAFPVFAEMVRSEDSKERISAISRFAMYDDKSVLPMLIELTKHDDPRTQSTAVRFLGRFKDQRATEAVLQAGQANRRNASDAISTLRRQGTEASIKGIAEFLKSKDQRIRKSAYDHLLGINSPLAKKLLLEVPISSVLPPGTPIFYEDRKHHAIIGRWGRPIDREEDCSISLVQGSHLRIETSKKVNTLLAKPNPANGPAVLQEVVGDFSIAVSLLPTEQNSENTGSDGLVVMSDLANVLLLERGRTAKSTNTVRLRTNSGKESQFVSKEIELADLSHLRLRLERSGSTFAAYVRKSGGDWRQVATQTVDLPSQVSVGVFATNPLGFAHQAEFADLQIDQPIKADGISKVEPPRANAPFQAQEAKRLQQRWAEYMAVPLEVENSIGMRFRLIPPGQFVMGSPISETARRDSERQHLVNIRRPFYLSVNEVTQQQYRKVVGVNPNSRQGTIVSKSGKPLPITSVDWQNSFDFCRKLSALQQEKEADRVYRLPGEAEWEFACRAGTMTAYYFGPKPDKTFANCRMNTGLKDVASYPPNPFGLYDMHGNVTEWCADTFHRDFHAQPLADKFPDEKNIRVSRGGAYADQPDGCRAAIRFSYTKNIWSFATGFRVALDLPTFASEARKRQEKIREKNFLRPRDEEKVDPLLVEISNLLRIPPAEITEKDYLRVNRLSLWYKTPIKDFSLIAKLKNLEHLSISTENFNEVDLKLLKHLPKLKTLSLRGANINGRGLVQLPNHALLEGLNLSDTKIDDSKLSNLASFVSLKSLDLNDTTITDTGLKTLKAFRKLERLSLRKTGVSDASAPILERLTSLKTVVLDDTKIGDGTLQSISKLPELEYLTLSNTLVTSRGITQLADLPSLKTLYLMGTAIGDKGALALSGMDQLSDLALNETNIGDKGFSVIASLPQLQSFSAVGTSVTDDGLKVLKDAKKLHTLGLSETNVQGSGLLALDGTERLGTLHLAGSRLDDKGMQAIASFPRLYVLNLSNTRITDAGLRLLKDTRSLRMITLTDTPIRGTGFDVFDGHLGLWSIDARGTQIDGSGIRAIGRIPGLKRLLLDRTPLNNDHVPDFSEIRHVPDISIAGTKIDEAGLLDLVTVVDSNRIGLDKSLYSDELIRKVEIRRSGVRLYLAK